MNLQPEKKIFILKTSNGRTIAQTLNKHYQIRPIKMTEAEELFWAGKASFNFNVICEVADDE